MDYLSKEQTNQIKGILCLLVVFGHSMNGYLELVGPWAVSVFFLLSGYALSYTSSKAEITPGFIFRKYKNILLPYVIVAVFYHLLFWKYPVVTDYNSIGGLIKGYLGFTPTVQAGWYIEVTLIMFLFYFVARKVSGNSPFKLLMSFIVLYVVFMVLVSFTDAVWVMRSPHCFILGVALHLFRKTIDEKFTSKEVFRYVALIVVAVTIILPNFFYTREDVLTNLVLFITYTLSPIVFIYISSNVTFNSKILKFFGKYSLWIYLFHVGVQYLLFSSVLAGKSLQSFLFFFLSLVLTLVIAVPVGILYNKISKKK